ncbi:hypothetical protein HDU76_009262, partial [Blyttiomyces sp. JEL0837]
TSRQSPVALPTTTTAQLPPSRSRRASTTTTTTSILPAPTTASLTFHDGKRLNYPPEIRSTLLAWLNQHRDHPYPTDNDKLELAKVTGLSLQQVNNWFINARRRKYQYMLGGVGSSNGEGDDAEDKASGKKEVKIVQPSLIIPASKNSPPACSTSSTSPFTPPSHSPYWKTAAGVLAETTGSGNAVGFQFSVPPVSSAVNTSSTKATTIAARRRASAPSHSISRGMGMEMEMESVAVAVESERGVKRSRSRSRSRSGGNVGKRRFSDPVNEVVKEEVVECQRPQVVVQEVVFEMGGDGKDASEDGDESDSDDEEMDTETHVGAEEHKMAVEAASALLLRRSSRDSDNGYDADVSGVGNGNCGSKRMRVDSGISLVECGKAGDIRVDAGKGREESTGGSGFGGLQFLLMAAEEIEGVVL